MDKIDYEDMESLRSDVEDLLKEGRYEIRWPHIKRKHPGVQKWDILHCLRIGYVRPDKNINGRYVAWSRIRGKLMRAAFEVRSVNGKLLLIVTAFWEEE